MLLSNLRFTPLSECTRVRPSLRNAGAVSYTHLDVYKRQGQYNVHAYSDSNQMQSRDIAQADGKKLSMSEVDGSWQSGSYNRCV